MSAEAEKVINLSLCKMAESRGIRRGGSSLHKHLLIASVLTKARSAYFENWYLGDNDCASVNTSDALPLTESSSETTGTDDQLGLSHILDPSFFVEVEAEIELPSDILNCVEKLGDMSDMHLGFTVSNGVDLNSRIQEEEDMLSEVDDDQVTSTTSDMIQGDGESEKTRTERQITYTYLDLDSSKEVPRSPPTSVPVSANSLPSLFSSISSRPISSQPTSKRRRGWNFDQEDDSDDEDEQVEVPCSSSPELQDKLRLNGRGSRHIAKRLRSSSSTGNPTNSSTEVFTSTTTTTTSLPVPSFNFDGNHFRTKKAHFEVDEEENSTEAANSDAFTDDDDDDSWCRSGKSCERNDRRVPSASSSCSSDEEQDTGSCSMEVDQITNLVQYFSFQKQQGNGTTSAPTGTVTNNKMSPSQAQSQLSNLSRSMSSPDLCGRSSSGSSNSSGSSCPSTKDLFSSYGLTNSHRILTMKV